MSESEWHWVAESVVYAIHDEQIAEHGGLAGLRDQALLLSALARPQQLEAYGDNPDIAALAAAYAVGVARNHPFLDGNKRTAVVVVLALLAQTGLILAADDASVEERVLAVADRRASLTDLTAWFRQSIRATPCP